MRNFHGNDPVFSPMPLECTPLHFGLRGSQEAIMTPAEAPLSVRPVGPATALLLSKRPIDRRSLPRLNLFSSKWGLSGRDNVTRKTLHVLLRFPAPGRDVRAEDGDHCLHRGSGDKLELVRQVRV